METGDEVNVALQVPPLQVTPVGVVGITAKTKTDNKTKTNNQQTTKPRIKH